jgi:glycosyltransferase involved in cell wall biosynthesis
MKVLYVTTAFVRSETDIITPWLTDVVKEVRSRGVDAQVFVSSYKGLGDQEVFGIPVRRFRYFFRKWEDLTHDETVPDRLKQGIRYKVLVLLYLVAGMFAMIRLCSKERWDIIHVHWPFPHAIFGYVGAKVCGAKMILNFHGVELRWVKTKMPFLLPFLRWAIKSSDGVVSNSRYTAREINSIVEREVAIIPFGIEDKAGKTRNASMSAKSILFVGRLVERKGVKYLVEAFDSISQEFPDCALTIVGDGSEKTSLEKLVTVRELKERVIFKGMITDAELERCYRDCTVFVLPSCTDAKGDKEGLGVVLLEAMSYRKPVIASDSGGIVDIVKHNDTGLLVPEKDIKALANALRNVLSDHSLADRLADSAHRYVMKNFSLHNITDRLLEIYSDSLRAQ